MNNQNSDTFVDAIGGVFFNGHVVKVDCLSLYPESSEAKKFSPRLTGRLVLPPASAAQLRDLLNQLFEKLEKEQKNNTKE